MADDKLTAPSIRLSEGERNQLIEDNLGYARGIAAKVKRDIGGDLDFEELVSYGTSGLVEAAGRFDPGRGVAFTTFSYYRIRGAIYDGLRQSGWLRRSEYARFQAASGDLLQNLSDRAGPSTGASDSTEAALQDLAENIDQLTTIFVTTLDDARMQARADPNAVDAEQVVGTRKLGQTVREAMARLPERERELIELYYFQDQTLEAAGRTLGLSKSWASRLHARAVKTLSGLLGPSDRNR